MKCTYRQHYILVDIICSEQQDKRYEELSGAVSSLTSAVNNVQKGLVVISCKLGSISTERIRPDSVTNYGMNKDKL